MHRARLFLSRFLLGLWAALVCAFSLLLLLNAPTANAPFSSVAIAAQPLAHLPTRIFGCTETAQQFQCQTDVQNRLLILTWQKGEVSQDDLTYPKDCEAVYGGQAVDCNNQGMGSVLGQLDRYEVANLGLSAR